MEERKSIRLKRCKVISKTGDTYLLNVRLESGRNCKDTYKKGDSYISWHEHNYPLTDDALAMVNLRADEFDAKAAEMQAGGEGFFIVEYKVPDVILHIRGREWTTCRSRYDVLYEYDAHTQRELVVAEGISADTLFRYIEERYGDTQDGETLEAITPTPQRLASHPLYLAALKNDRPLTAFMEKEYGRYSPVGRGILPPVGEEFDREFTVVSDTIPYRVFERSGYAVHRIEKWGLRGHNNVFWSINPYRMVAQTAAEIGEEELHGISFAEFVRIIGG